MHEYIYIPKCHLLLGSNWLYACEYGGCAHCTSSECFLLLATIGLSCYCISDLLAIPPKC